LAGARFRHLPKAPSQSYYNRKKGNTNGAGSLAGRKKGGQLVRANPLSGFGCRCLLFSPFYNFQKLPLALRERVGVREPGNF
jgi:hypothetical protein